MQMPFPFRCGGHSPVGNHDGRRRTTPVFSRAEDRSRAYRRNIRSAPDPVRREG